MLLKDVLAMEVPSGVLKEIVKSKQIKSKLNSIEEMAISIAEQDTNIGNQLANEFKFAGSTAVNLNIVMKGIPVEWHDKGYFKTKLGEKYSPQLFTEGLRPKLDFTPKLISVFDNGTKLILAFSFLGTPRRYFENYQIVSRSPQIVEYVVIHFSPFAIEVRASQEQNKVFRDEVINIMDCKVDDVVWKQATKLTELEANELAKKLNARLRAAKHKMTEGPYATKEVTANTQTDDLERTEVYKKEFINQPMKKKTLIFDFTYSFGYKDSISYVITDESLWIRSKVGEEVITFILDTIKEIKSSASGESDLEAVEDINEIKLAVEVENHINEQLAIDLK